MAGWFSVQRMSLARSTSSPAASAFFDCRLSTIASWFAWKSLWIRLQSAAISALVRRTRRALFGVPIKVAVVIVPPR